MPIEVISVKQEGQQIYGLWAKSSDKAVSKDIPTLSKKYYDILAVQPGAVLPFFVLSQNYDVSSGEFDLFIGGKVNHEQLQDYQLPEGSYGRIVVKPKLGFLWGKAIGEAKRYFYSKWLPASDYEALNMEYEFHTEKSLGKKPEIDLLFAIKEKQL